MKALLFSLALASPIGLHAAVPFEGSVPAQLRVAAAFRSGKLSEALNEAKNALQGAEDDLGPAHPSLAPLLEDLAAIQRHRAEFADAEQSYLKALSLRGKDPSRAITLRHLAALWMDLGNPILAGEYLKQARAIGPDPAQESAAPEDPQAAVHAAAIYESLGLLERAVPHLIAQKNYAPALEAEKKILKINNTHYGEGHPRTGLGLVRISEIYLLMDNSKEAKKTKTQGLVIAEKALGSDHPELKKLRLISK